MPLHIRKKIEPTMGAFFLSFYFYMHRKKIYLPLEFIFLSLGSKVILVRAQIVFFFVIVLGYERFDLSK
jgi:hypothetical protein